MVEKKQKCVQCGKGLEAGARFCENCEAPVPEREKKKKASASRLKPEMQYGKHIITWNAEIPLLTSTVIIRQLAFVLAVSSLCVLVFVLMVDAFEGNLTLAGVLRTILITLLVFGGLSLLAVVIMLFFYGNRYENRFIMDEIGVTAETIAGTRKKNAIVNLLLLLSGKPGPAGAGLIAASRQSEQVKWEKVNSLTTDPNKLEIVLRRGGRALMLIRCTPENYPRVLKMAQEALATHST